jgi:hypothetical protein
VASLGRSCRLQTFATLLAIYRYVRAAHPTESGRQGRLVIFLWDGPFLPLNASATRHVLAIVEEKTR